MAEQTKPAKQDNQRQLRGGTEGGELSRAMEAPFEESGTPSISSPAGAARVVGPAHIQPSTRLPAVMETPRLFGGKSPDMIRGYLAGLSFPAKKDAIVRTASHNHAPEDVTAALVRLGATEYRSFEEMLLDYPRLPDENEVEPNKGRTSA
jgi:hypothetical protein